LSVAGVLGYVLDENVGFVLRQVTQRHLAIFSEMMADDLTPTQFSAIVRLYEHGSCSQNRLGRLTAMDGPTIKGVIDRLTRRGITTTSPDQEDSRLLIISLTGAGRRVAERAIPRAKRITEATLAPLSLSQRTQLMALLGALRADPACLE
jgi:DNA-binding MarR family transcriptional regulator